MRMSLLNTLDRSYHVPRVSDFWGKRVPRAGHGTGQEVALVLYTYQLYCSKLQSVIGKLSLILQLYIFIQHGSDQVRQPVHMAARLVSTVNQPHVAGGKHKHGEQGIPLVPDDGVIQALAKRAQSRRVLVKRPGA